MNSSMIRTILKFGVLGLMDRGLSFGIGKIVGKPENLTKMQKNMMQIGVETTSAKIVGVISTPMDPYLDDFCDDVFTLIDSLSELRNKKKLDYVEKEAIECFSEVISETN